MSWDRITMEGRADPGVVLVLQRASLVLYSIVALTGLAIVTVWALHGMGFAFWLPPSKFNTGLVLLLLGAGGALAQVGRRHASRRLAMPALALAGLSMLEYVLGTDLGIDEVLLSDPEASTHPGRMAPNTAVALTCASLAALIGGRGLGAWIGQALAIASAVIAMLALVGHAIGHEGFTSFMHATAMPAPAAIAIVMLGLARLASTPGRGVMLPIVAAGAGGTLARRMVPAVVLIPVLVGFAASTGTEAGLWGYATSQWLLLVAISVTLLGLSLWIARTVQQLDRERAESRERTESFFELSRDLLCTIENEEHFAELNASWTRVLGWQLDELRERPAIEFVHPDDREMTRSLGIQALENPDADIVLENRYRTRDGGWRWLSWSIRPGHDGVYLYGRATDISERKLEDERLIRLARHDGLTGLANRQNFDERLDHHLVHASRYGWRGALLAIDLDGLKKTNDTDGHAAGDELLKATASRLKEALRSSDVIARIGGDEFAVLLPEVDRATAATVAEKLVRSLAFGNETKTAPVASVGVAVIDEPTTASSLLARADHALYEAKGAGGGTFRIDQERATGPGPAPSVEETKPAPSAISVSVVR